MAGMSDQEKRKKVKAKAKKARSRLGAIQGLFGGLLGSATNKSRGRKGQIDDRIRQATGG